MTRLLRLTIAVAMFAAGGCQQSPEATDAETASPAAAEFAAEPDSGEGIGWFDGTVDEAFAHAAETGKPVYLYWGAEWCPPCHAIAATVFTRPEFIERSKLFVPVYLDGDEPNAQAQGERFGVFGYPTMIVFDSAGRELTRIPGGIDIQAYANVLDLTLNAASPANAIVRELLGGDAGLTTAECRLLAYHSWRQDATILADVDQADAFRRMYAACPAEMRSERSILYLTWLDAALDALEEDESLPDERREEARAWIRTVVSDPELVKANIFNVLFSGPRLVQATTDAGSVARAMLTAEFQQAFDRIAADESVYKRERIYTLMGRIGFERIDDDEAPISDALRERIRATAEWADASTPGIYERQPIINALANVLDEAGMDDVARPLLLAELERSKQPYYFMVGLADIEQRAGNDDAAIKWLQKAWESSRGPATRFQWGYYYLQGLIEMTPDDTQRIRDVAVTLITEIQESGGIYQRPKAQLGRLEGHLREWGETRTSALDALRDSVRDVCVRIPTEDDACEKFLGSV